MGTYLSVPVTAKDEMEGTDLKCKVTPLVWAAADMQGWRKSMEDAHIARTDLPLPDSVGGGGNEGEKKVSSAAEGKEGEVADGGHKAKMFAVFDGHGGKEVAMFCERYFADVFVADPLYKSNEIPGEQLLHIIFKISQFCHSHIFILFHLPFLSI
jgi:hypothetical protein